MAAPPRLCGNPRCEAPLPNVHHGRRYCDFSCRDQARYLRDPEARKARSKAYYHANIEAGRKVRAEYERRNSEAARRRWHAWMEKHPGVARAQARERWRENPEEYRTKHRAHQGQRRARVAGASGRASPDQVAARFAMWGGRCSVPGCGRPGDTIDHAIPLARGGSHWPANLRPMCRAHNCAKSDLTISEFLARAA
jgi:5-methylcytosine-specific restriction endonuclease McrA